jgi:hypothetical protein
VTDAPTDAPIDVADLAKKSSVAWILVGDEPFPVWHEWVESEVDGGTQGAICVVSSSALGGSEQHLPDYMDDGRPVWVLLRSKTDRQLAAAVPVVVEVVEPGSDLWQPVTAALKAGRLNAPDLSTIVDRWARECRVLRLVPSGVPAPAAAAADAHPRTSPRLS